MFQNNKNTISKKEAMWRKMLFPVLIILSYNNQNNMVDSKRRAKETIEPNGKSINESKYLLNF